MGGVYYRVQDSATPGLYLVGTHIWDVQPLIFLTGVVVIVVVVTVPSVVLWDMH